LVGKRVLLPLMEREIPIIADEMVDREFGTGAVKITPAHDPNDFEVGRRHHLPEIDVMTDNGPHERCGGRLCRAGAIRGAEGDCRRFEGARVAGENHRAHARRWDMRAEQDDCGAAGFDAVVLQDETSGGPAIAAVERGEIQIVRRPAPGILQLD